MINARMEFTLLRNCSFIAWIGFIWLEDDEWNVVRNDFRFKTLVFFRFFFFFFYFTFFFFYFLIFFFSTFNSYWNFKQLQMHQVMPMAFEKPKKYRQLSFSINQTENTESHWLKTCKTHKRPKRLICSGKKPSMSERHRCFDVEKRMEMFWNQ